MMGAATGSMGKEVVVAAGWGDAGVLSTHERLEGGEIPGPEPDGYLEGYGAGGPCVGRFGLGLTNSGI